MTGLQVLDSDSKAIRTDDWSNQDIAATSWETLHSLLKRKYLQSGGVFSTEHTVRFIQRGQDGSKLEIGVERLGDEPFTITADRIIGADGASSSVRRLCESTQTRRTYAGYVVWRGTVPEKIVSQLTYDALNQKISPITGRPGRTGICYTIPGDGGELTQGDRLLNWADYAAYTAGELERIMTDVDGLRHDFTVPAGQVNPEAWTQYKKGALPGMPAAMQELVQKTDRPIIQVITDTLSERAAFLDGKALLVGEAVANPRPHAGSGLAQGAMAARKTHDLFNGDCTVEDWEAEVLKTARDNCEAGIKMARVLGMHEKGSVDGSIDIEDAVGSTYRHQRVPIEA